MTGLTPCGSSAAGPCMAVMWPTRYGNLGNREEETYFAQHVFPKKPQVFLRFEDEESHIPPDQRNLMLNLLTELSTDFLISLNSTDRNFARYQQLVQKFWSKSTSRKQIIAHENRHRYWFIKQFTVSFKDTTNQDLHRTVILSPPGEFWVANHQHFQSPIHTPFTVNLTPCAPPIEGGAYLVFYYAINLWSQRLRLFCIPVGHFPSICMTSKTLTV